MIRLGLICLVSAIIVGSDLTGHFAAALTVGTLVGAGLFVAAALKGGGLRPVGLAAPHLLPPDFVKRNSDPKAGIGCALAASGIASSVVTNDHYPYSFRVFYAVCIAAGVVIAIGLAWRARMD